MEYVDSEGVSRTQLAIVGEQSVTLLKGLALGLTTDRDEPAGVAAPWLRDAIFKALGKKVPEAK